MALTAFDKYEGLGNDFVLLEVPRASFVDGRTAARICDRHLGVGADGVLLLLPPRASNADARLQVLNADGSTPEMCGNGLRCVALHLARKRSPARTFLIETDIGPLECTTDGPSVTVGMGIVRCQGQRHLDIDGTSSTFTLVDAGNPHAVTFGAHARADVDRLGPRVASHASFPQGTNVEFATVDRGSIDLVVWERGVGITLACGTGACATVAAAYASGLIASPSSVDVRLPGGLLVVTLDPETSRASLRGPARHVFSGALPASLIAEAR
jgi:diaminopimelate epimerase